MSTEQNKAIARRAIDELWNGRNAEVIDELFAEDYHDPAVTAGLRAWKEAAIALFAEAPPDWHITIEDQIAEGDKVVTRWTWSFTHTVAFYGAAPTGKYISFTGISIYRLEGGKIVEGWFNGDGLGLQRQLGKIA
ncbi:MAG: ester cyclase [Anaerolineae bacterium]|nr:ester cyclase [Anaerolineae bacterium]